VVAEAVVGVVVDAAVSVVVLEAPDCSDGSPTAESQAPTSASVAISGSAVRTTLVRRGGAALFFTSSLPVAFDRTCHLPDLFSDIVHRLR
jgi:hypothetical protein